MGVSHTICPGWPQTSILPISASHVARVTGLSHQLQAREHFFVFLVSNILNCKVRLAMHLSPLSIRIVVRIKLYMIQKHVDKVKL
jgi:hypothetical protein